MYYNAATYLIQPPGVTSQTDIAEIKNEKARRNKVINYTVLISLFSLNLISFIFLVKGGSLPTNIIGE